MTGLTGAFRYLSRRASRKAHIDAAFSKAAPACGVTGVQWYTRRIGYRGEQQSFLLGRWGSLTVTFHAQATRGIVVIGGPSSVLADVSMRLERTVASVYSRLSPEIEVGDPDFDDAVYVEGPAPLLRAILGEPTRGLLLRLLRGRVTELARHPLHVQIIVLHGQVNAELSPHEPGGPWTALPEALGLVLDTARHFVLPQDLPVRLARNASHDSLDAVRAANLSTLAQEYPDADLTRATVRAACDDPSDEVRLQAAVALGPEGRRIVLAIATREDAAEEHAARAVETLGVDLPADTCASLLARALRAGQTSLALACVASLGRGGAPESVKILADVLASTHDNLGAAAARALAKTGRPEAEGPLLTALGDAAEAVRVAAAGALGEVGTAAAVLPLREMAEGEGGEVRRAARTAVAQIQARVTGASPGQLSLSAGPAGHISLSEDE
ncbi:MAG TPA: HEAT repeat domain-containing protein, partial [Vicinamibacteria bacterium]|nr:HEAT repeat domain-containing protein [Vicinamibacteria bacterium]